MYLLRNIDIRVAKERYFFQKVFGQNCKISQKHFLYFNLSHMPFVALYVVLKTFLYHFSTIFEKIPRWLIKEISKTRSGTFRSRYISQKHSQLSRRQLAIFRCSR